MEAYDIGLGGRLGGGSQFVRPIHRKVPADKIKFALENLLTSYRCTRLEEESFGEWTDKLSNEQLGEYLGLHLLAQDDPDWTPPPIRSHAPVGAE